MDLRVYEEKGLGAITKRQEYPELRGNTVLRAREERQRTGREE